MQREIVDTCGAIQRGNSMGKAKGLDARSEGDRSQG